MEIKVRKFKDSDIEQVIEIWNSVVIDGIAFPQEDILDVESGKEFFSAQT